MKIKIGVLMIMLGVVFASCGRKTKSYAEWKKEEKQAIDALIAKENFEIIHSYPANGVFGERQFVLLDNGCYLNVIDSGNGNRAISGRTVVLMRCSTIGITPSDTVPVSIFPNSFAPLEFVYGKMNEAKVLASGSFTSAAYLLLSPGVESALDYVGENSIVRMIIPFDNGQSQEYLYGIGSAYQDNNLVPMYYDRIRFVFDEY